MRVEPTTIARAPGSARLRSWPGRADLISLALLLAAAVFMLSQLERWPPWFDEGWTLAVAETWVERGHYGLLAADGPRGKSLAAAFPTVASTALSFKLFGVGIWQGRLPAALFTLGALAMLAALARRLAGPRVAAATLAVALLTGHATVSPLSAGIQTLAEPAMLCLLAAAYLALPAALDRPWPYLALFWLCAGLGLATKGQPLPFVALSLLVPAALALCFGQRRAAALLGLALAGALAVWQLLPILQAALLAGSTAPSEPIPGLNSVVGLVLAPDVRVTTILVGLLGATVALTGLAAALWRQLWRLPQSVDGPGAIARTALLAFAGSWAAWYLLLSVGWPRYLLPPAFFAAFFAAEQLAGLTGGLDLRATLARLRPGTGSPRALLVAALMLVVYASGAQALLAGMAATVGSPPAEPARARAVAWLNRNTPPGALVETYESELIFQLERPYHYPPDRYHPEIIRMHEGWAGATTSYDPLARRPALIAEGRFARNAGLYTEAIAAGGYQLVFSDGVYRIFARNP